MSKRTIVRRPAKKNADTKVSTREKQPAVADEEATMWQHLHVISERWRSDLVFFYDELNFLRKLIDKYFIRLIQEENIDIAREVVSDLGKLEKRRYAIMQKLDHHRICLANLITNPFSFNAQDCKEEHAEIDGLFTGFVKDARQSKKNVFELTEQIMDSERAKNLLTE